MRAAALVACAALGCGGLVERVPDAGAEPAPPAASPDAAPTVPEEAPGRAAWADYLCGAEPAAVAAVGAARRIVTRERDSYSDAPEIVRVYDGTMPDPRRRACVRDDSPTACTCRELEPGEALYVTRAP